MDCQGRREREKSRSVYEWVHLCVCSWASQVVLEVKNPSTNIGDARDTGSISGSGRSPVGGMATHSSIPACRIPRTEEPGGPQCMGWQRMRHDGSDLARHIRLVREMMLCSFVFGKQDTKRVKD